MGSNDLIELWEHVVEQTVAASSMVHGLGHWKRVEKNGLVLAEKTGANVEVVKLFAVFHDSKRVNDDDDPGHGARGSAFAKALRGEKYELDDAAFALLEYACIWHTNQQFTNDVTIGTCWDADRLDLGRVGIIPQEDYMSTAFGKEVARAGSFYEIVHRQDGK